MALDMDMEKGMQMQQAMGAAPDAQVPPVTGKGGKEPLLPNLNNMQPAEGGVVVVAGKMKPGQNKWRLLYWLLVGSVILVTNSIHTAPKYKMIIPQEVAAMVVFLCAICFIIFTMLN